MKKNFLMLGLLIALPASAEGIYVFGDVGQSKLLFDTSIGDISKTDTTYAVGVGYEATQTFSFELAYRDLGTTVIRTDYGRFQTDGSALQASVVAKFPISPTVNIFGRVGVSDLTYKFKFQYFDSSEEDESTSETESKAFYGVGASYAFNEKLLFRAEYNGHAEWENVTISTLAVGAVYKF
jgi:OmpA-OmpF porin, OOP family